MHLTHLPPCVRLLMVCVCVCVCVCVQSQQKQSIGQVVAVGPGELHPTTGSAMSLSQHINTTHIHACLIYCLLSAGSDCPLTSLSVTGSYSEPTEDKTYASAHTHPTWIPAVVCCPVCFSQVEYNGSEHVLIDYDNLVGKLSDAPEGKPTPENIVPLRDW